MSRKLSDLLPAVMNPFGILPPINNDFFDTFGKEDFFDVPFVPDFMSTRKLKAELIENDTNYVLKVDVAGFDKEDIKVELEDGAIVVTAAKEKKETSKEDGKVLWSDINYSTKCRRVFSLTNTTGYVKKEDIKAKIDDGHLLITIAKEEKKDEPVVDNTITIE